MRARNAPERRLGWLVVVLLIGCAGQIQPPGSGDEDPNAWASDPYDPGPTYLRRLTKHEYVRTVSTLLGVDEATFADVVPEDSESDGFNNNARGQTISFQHAQAYQEAAERVVREVMADVALRDRLIGCDPTGVERLACLRAFVDGLGRRAFRRPLLEEEAQSLVTRFESAATAAEPYGDIALIVRAVLQSPKFLFRVEVGAPDPEHPVRRRLTGSEIATRLSFLILGRGPDDWLLDQAEMGVLDSAEGIEAAARQMLDAPEARSAMRELTTQWFQIPRLAASTAPLRSSMADEMNRLIDDAIWTDDADFLDLYTAPYGYADTPLAALYGVTAPAGGGMARVAFLPEHERAGLLTTAGVLVLTSKPDQTFPTKRGKYVRDVVLCDPVPPPPPGIVPTEAREDESVADVLARHANDPACSGCHEKLDPIGKGLEMYDHLGALRDVDALGESVRFEGLVAGVENGTRFNGGVELGQLVRGSEMTSTCVVRQLLRWSFGHSETSADTSTIRGVHEAFEASGHDFRELVVALVRSDAFRHRRSEEEP